MNTTETQRRFAELASLIDGARMLLESREEEGILPAMNILSVAVDRAMDAAEEAQTCPEDQPV